jgi:hypothetical protein
MRVVEVPGSHVGLVWNPATYRALAHHLREANARAVATSGGGEP